ncbi:class F sortase [Georgenia sp. Z1491]|uniref:class F sortase n=1 Tax=Georgenia sp. Z1491 TaxID=3416707 RepID=UPI003CEE64B5
MPRIHGRRAGLTAGAAAVLLVLGACSGTDEPDYADPVGPSASSTPDGDRGSTTPNGEQVPPSDGAAPDAPTDGPGPAPSPGDGSSSPTDAPAPQEDGAQEAEEVPVADAMPASEPARIEIPSLGVSSEVMDLGRQENGVIEVPPYNLGSPAGWYVHSPTPGEAGPSVVLGHRNGSEGGPGIFADLPRTEVGDTVEVTREDGSVATFTVYRTEQFYQQEFPTLDVYGNTAGPEIRLITCDGLNPETGQLEDNFIVYAALDA